jgi:hypothetical protein
MNHEITHIDAVQTSKILALVSAAVTVPFFGLVLVMVALGKAPHNTIPWFVLIIMPILYGMVGFIFTLIGCAVYNFLAKRIGGVRYTTAARDGS